jgi:mannan endo-1,4-beta-mannosidase
MQVWHCNGTSTINLTPLDKVVKAAEQSGMKLVVALTNNWADYGGMDVYTVNLVGRYHDDVRFYPAFHSLSSSHSFSASGVRLRGGA